MWSAAAVHCSAPPVPDRVHYPRQCKIFEQSWKGKQDCAAWPCSVGRDVRATDASPVQSDLPEGHSSTWNHQPHGKDTSGSGTVMERTLLPPVACHRIELLAYCTVATEKESDVTMLSTWREDYLLPIISFTFILPSSLKCVCWLRQIPFKIFQPEMDYCIQQPQHLNFGEERRLLLCFHASSPLSSFSPAVFWNTQWPCCIPQKPLTHRSSCSRPVALSTSSPACCTLTKKPNQKMLL